jgi:hypothetical protein
MNLANDRFSANGKFGVGRKKRGFYGLDSSAGPAIPCMFSGDA